VGKEACEAGGLWSYLLDVTEVTGTRLCNAMVLKVWSRNPRCFQDILGSR
jgi:hypothetical protein